MEGSNMSNVHDVANNFLLLDKLNDGEGISHLKLQKLVYYAQGFYLAIFDIPIFEERIEAWMHGPVSPDLYDTYSAHGSNLLSVDEKFNSDVLNENEKELIDEVYNVYGQFSAWKLRNMTHDESPWQAHESEADVIPQDEMKEYFKGQLN